MYLKYKQEKGVYGGYVWMAVHTEKFMLQLNKV